jgi:Putative transposase, YhgA-like
LEHKSSPDLAARLQLLRYIVRILVNWYEQHGKRLPLPPVLPLLVHQGPGDWESSCEFVDLFGAVPGILRPHLPSFRHVLVDLGRVADEHLSAQPRLRAHLKALKYARRQDLPEKMDVLLAEAPVLEVLDVALILQEQQCEVLLSRVAERIQRAWRGLWLPCEAAKQEAVVERESDQARRLTPHAVQLVEPAGREQGVRGWRVIERRRRRDQSRSIDGVYVGQGRERVDQHITGEDGIGALLGKY